MKKAVALFIICVLAGTSANAQYDDDSRGFRLKRPSTDHREIAPDMSPHVTLMRTAACLVQSSESDIRSYLQTVPASEGEAAALKRFEKEIGECMPAMDMSMIGNQRRAQGQMTMRLDNASLRGALAEALLRDDGNVIDYTKLAIGDDAIFVAERFHGNRSSEPERAFSLGFAGCVMGSHPDRLPALFETEPGSNAERASIIAFSDSFGPCVMEGQTLSIDPPGLRNQLAEVVYYALEGAVEINDAQ